MLCSQRTVCLVTVTDSLYERLFVFERVFAICDTRDTFYRSNALKRQPKNFEKITFNRKQLSNENEIKSPSHQKHSQHHTAHSVRRRCRRRCCRLSIHLFGGGGGG